jgi:hypothetical protein
MCGVVRASRILNGEKRGFSIPRAAWLRAELQRSCALFTRMIDDHVARRADHGRKIWALLVFALVRPLYGAFRVALPRA